MTGQSSALVAPKAQLTGHARSLAPSLTLNPRVPGSNGPPLNMKILVLAGTSTEFSYQSITTYLNQIGVPYRGVAVDTLTPDSAGNRLSGLALSDPATGRGLYQGIIETNSTFGVCNPTCAGLLTATDFATIDNYASFFKVRVVGYYTYPEPKWGLTSVSEGSHTVANPLKATLTPAGAAIFTYINSKNAIPVSGSGTGGIYAYHAATTAAPGETTTAILTAGADTVGVTHTTVDGRETMALTFDNYPTLLHSLAFSYGVVNWVTRGVFLGSRQIYFNPQDDDILLGNRLYAPTQAQCPADPGCPYIRGTAADLQALANWQNARRLDPQFPHFQTTFAFVGVGSTPGNAPYQDDLPAAMTAMAGTFGWVNHTWHHPNFDCYTISSTGACLPSDLNQSLYELERNIAYGNGIGIPSDTTGLVTPLNGGLSNQPFLQSMAWEGITSVIYPLDPPTPGTGIVSPLVPSILLMPRRVTNLFDDVDSPLTGVSGSLPDKYNSLYGPNGKTPVFSTNQTYSQIIDNESTTLLQTRSLTYEPFPLGFHTSNSIAYDGVHSMMTDLFDATIAKYEKLYTLPVNTLPMRDIAPLLLNRMSYNVSGVTGVYTPGVSVVLTSPKAATIPVTGACSQATCPVYGDQMQDSVAMAPDSSVTLVLNAGPGAALTQVTLNPASVGAFSPSQGLVTLNGIAGSTAVVSLQSNSALASVPANVTIPAGNSGAAFTVVTGAVSSVTTATISATYNGVTRTFPLTISPAVALSGISLNPATVAGGSATSGTVSLTAPAPADGFAIQLLSNNAAATVPTSVTVSAGSSSATFPVTTSAVTAVSAGSIVAVYNSINKAAALTVTSGSVSPVLSGVSLNPASVAGGSPSTGTVTLTAAAPASGIVVALSSNSASATPLASVTVSAGSTSATFSLTTKAVAASTSATITATSDGVTQTAVLIITPATAAVSLTGISLNPSSVTGGSSATGTVTLTAAAPVGGLVVALSGNNANVTLQSAVTVSEGNSSATFAVATTTVAVSTSVTIAAAYSGVTKTAALTVNPSAAVVSLSGVSLSPASVTGGSSSTGTVTLTAVAPTGGIVVSLSDNSANATVPASVTVIGGASTATFIVTTRTVTASSSVTITAASSGTSKIAVLTIAPAVTLTGLSLNPASVIGGSSSTGTVTLAAPAPAGGLVISLSDTSKSDTIPASVTIAAGSSSATFAITTKAVKAVTSANISAAYNGVSKTAVLTLNPAVTLTGLSVSPSHIESGDSSNGTITLSGPAPAGGVAVLLKSNSSVAGIPVSVTVPAGSSRATFTVATEEVFFFGDITITASYGSVSKSDVLTVTW